MVERIPRISSNLLACSVTRSDKLLLLGRMKTFIALKCQFAMKYGANGKNMGYTGYLY